MRARLAMLIAATALTAACQPGALLGGGAPDTAEIGVPEGTLDLASATAALPALPVAAPADVPGYERDCGPGDGCVFGPSWSDDVGVAFGRNGCDTRNDILARDLQPGTVNGRAVPKRVEDNNCVVLEGVLADPFTGQTLHFTKKRAGALQVDHVVALAAAWRAGASTWQPQVRQDFANDPRNLILVDGGTNQSKGDSTADEWLPPNADYHCEYARIVVTVKSAYGLSVTAAEQQALQSVLGRCSTTPPAP
ncbi:MAG TPA: HNH endonuclease family protein [Pseudonocardiaceae bacterium]